MMNQYNKNEKRHGLWEYRTVFGLACVRGCYSNGVKVGYWEEYSINIYNNKDILKTKIYYV